MILLSPQTNGNGVESNFDLRRERSPPKKRAYEACGRIRSSPSRRIGVLDLAQGTSNEELRTINQQPNTNNSLCRDFVLVDRVFTANLTELPAAHDRLDGRGEMILVGGEVGF